MVMSLMLMRFVSGMARTRGYQRTGQRASFALSLCLLFTVFASAQGTKQTDEAPQIDPRLVFSDSIEVQWVLIPAIVQARNQFVPGLASTDFELLVDGHEVAIENFEGRSDHPVSLIYLQDLSGSMRNLNKLTLSRAALDLLVNQSGDEDEVSLVSFAGSEVRVDHAFSTDEQAARAVSADWQASGTTALYDALTWLPELSLEGRQMRRAAVVVTDGLDNASLSAPETSRNHLMKTQLPVYVIDLSLIGRPNGGTNDQTKTQVLQDLAQLTGGRYFRPGHEAGVYQAAAALAREIRSHYVLGFAADGARASARHEVEIRVRGRRNKTHHRPAYFGPPPFGIAANP